MPEGLDPRQATALILDWMTAYGMLEHSAKVTSGQRVFVHGLSGGVGTAFLHLAQLPGAAVFGTASASKQAELSASGARVFDYRQKEWIRELQRLGAWKRSSIRWAIGALMRAIPSSAKVASWWAMGAHQGCLCAR